MRARANRKLATVAAALVCLMAIVACGEEELAAPDRDAGGADVSAAVDSAQPPALTTSSPYTPGEALPMPPLPPEAGAPVVDTGAPPADTGPADTGPADTGPADTGPADTGPADVQAQ